ncbi:hypothetical protein FWD07_01520 [Candidatus Saccharibacteria bacterium]|nr:hypothetical protein [Candidatus Saccharibacteria bacterium]
MKILITALMVAVLAVAPVYAVEGDLLDEWVNENPQSNIMPTSEDLGEGFLPGSEGWSWDGDESILPILDDLVEPTDEPGQVSEDIEEEEDENGVWMWALIGGAGLVLLLAVVVLVARSKKKN